MGPQTYKFNPSNGKTIWQYSGPVEGGGGATAVDYGGNLYVSDIFSYASTFNQLQALNNSNGAGVYSTISGSLFQHISPPAFFNNTGYVTYGTELEAFNATNGTLLWTKVFADGSTSLTAPLAVNGYLYLETSAGNLEVLDGTSGSLLDTLNLGSGGNAFSGFGFDEGLAAANGLLAVPEGQDLVVLAIPEPSCSAVPILVGLLLCRRKRSRAVKTVTVVK